MNKKGDCKYSAAVLERARELWAAGKSASIIARMLGEEGLAKATKNVIIGLSRRQGFPAREVMVKLPPKMRPTVGPRKAMGAHRPGPPIFARVQAAATRAALKVKAVANGKAPPQHSGCQWIEGEPTHNDSCKHGAPRAPGSLYCAEHQARSRVARSARLG